MDFRYPTEIQQDIEYVESELEENESAISGAEWLRHRLEKRIATYGSFAAPLPDLKHLEEAKKRLEELEADKKALEAKRLSYEAELEQALRFQEDRYRLDSGEKLEPTVESLERLIEEGEALLAASNHSIIEKLASYYYELAHTIENRGNGDIAIRSLKRTLELCRQSGDEAALRSNQSYLVNLLIKYADKYRNAGNNGLALNYYLEAKEIVSTINDLEREASLLGDMARIHDTQNELKKALDSRLDRIDCLVKLERISGILSEIKSLRSLCRRFQNMETQQHWIDTTHRLVKRFFIKKKYVKGFELLRNLSDEFGLEELSVTIQESIDILQPH